ncbi:helix-turn-helix domain-containing protein [Lyngbya sp. CCY1209]|uniref:helix-turn-helix domain-containing protein n=1 Tax=Lyngbya sp. CCY1209 TaxID=2886103 RepID=UPI002D213DDD|nr:helix-turn-helix domain-containing protein [Lyngbya sp. CCY1209]MEB3884080.1 helix-turn-helix domain-containing protein [Lyngbya sp. CCY1209]
MTFNSTILGEVKHPTNLLKEYLAAFKNRCQAAIVSWFDGWGKWAWATVRGLAEELGYHKDTICTHLNKLVRAGILRRREAKRWPTDKAYEYRIDPEALVALVWEKAIASLMSLPPKALASVGKFGHGRADIPTPTGGNSDNNVNLSGKESVSSQTAFVEEKILGGREEETRGAGDAPDLADALEAVARAKAEIVEATDTRPPEAMKGAAPQPEDKPESPVRPRPSGGDGSSPADVAPKDYNCATPEADPRYGEMNPYEQEAVDLAAEGAEELMGGRLTPGVVWLLLSKPPAVILTAVKAALKYARAQRGSGRRIDRPIGVLTKAIGDEWKPNKPPQKGQNGAWREYEAPVQPLHKLKKMYGAGWREAAKHFGHSDTAIAEFEAGGGAPCR